MAAFLDDPAVSTLRASVGAEDGAITVANEVASPNERAPRGSYHLVLSKASPGALALEDLPGKLVVSSFAGRKELHAFYRAIKSVYAPLAAQQQSSSSGGGDDGGAADGLGLRALAKELEAGLGAAVRRGGKAKGRDKWGSCVLRSVALRLASPRWGPAHGEPPAPITAA